MALDLKQRQVTGESGGRTRLALGVALTLVLVAGFGYLVLGTPNHWLTYTDPHAGYSFSYPCSWLLATDPDGGAGSVIDPATRAVVTVSATTVSEPPAAALAAVLPNGAAGVSSRTIAGAPAAEVTLGSVRAGGSGSTDSDPGARRQVREVIVAAYDSAGTTNLYTLALTQAATAAGATSDDATFDQLAASFSPASSGLALPFFSHPGVPAPIRMPAASTCSAICWADANWSADDYANDANGRDCAGFDGNAGQYVACATRTQAALGDFQPEYQCSEFVARALAQDGFVPGLTSGGSGSAEGPGGGTGQFGNVSYNSYPFTDATNAAGGNARYNLLGVGTPGAAGLYDYLLTSGIGINIHQNLSEAAPGDVVFFYTGALANANREHVMLMTSLVRYPAASQGIGGWDALVDGHNRAAYHSLLSTLVAGDYPFEIIHLRAAHGSASSLSTSGAGWSRGTDGYGQPFAYVATTSAATPSATAQAHFTAAGACDLVAYVPNSDATAVVTFSVTLANGTTLTRPVDESSVDGWVLLYRGSGTGTGPVSVAVGNAIGSDGQSLGVGQVYALCAA